MKRTSKPPAKNAAEAFNTYESMYSGFNSENRTLQDPEFEVFLPFATLQHREHVIITTWGVAPPEFMKPVLRELNRACHVHLLVGYSKETHDLDAQRDFLYRYYRDYQLRIHLLPGAHSKVWIIGDKVYCGSQNFVQGGAPNYMAAVHPDEVDRVRWHVREMLKAASEFSATSKLQLVKPAYGTYRLPENVRPNGDSIHGGNTKQAVSRKTIRGPLRSPTFEWPGSEAFGGDVRGGNP